MKLKKEDLPSKRKYPLIEVFYTGGSDSFICGYNGDICGLDDIEKELFEEETEWSHGKGIYLFEANYEPEQTGEYGRVELAGYWNFELMYFEAFEKP